jgi:dipeptidyl aminopeptidase/acylaminoacyl peptidase
MATQAPFGSWRSSITVDMVTGDAVGLALLEADGGDVYWTESRPQDGGHTAIVRWSRRSGVADVTPPGFNARSRVHEYGGGSFAVDEGLVVACSFDDQRVYRLDGPEPVPITPEPPIACGLRYADLVFHGDVVIAVRERHRRTGEPINELVAFPVDGSTHPEVIVAGNDFYSTPRPSPDGRSLAWLTWNHPNMPWDGTELWVGALDEDGGVSEPERVAGGATESIFQPEWSPHGILHYVSDRTGWWNLYRLHDGEPGDLYPAEADFGAPEWLFGMRRYTFTPDGSIVCIYDLDGRQHVAHLANHTLTTWRVGCNVLSAAIVIAGGRTFLIGGSATMPMSVVAVDGAGTVEVLRPSLTVDVPIDRMSIPEAIEFPTTDDAKARAFWYPPTNPDFVGPPGERPPLLVLIHGGPTGQARADLNLELQFWTSRGFGVVDVNYRGSSGFGRAYRKALEGKWGIADVADCIAAAGFLADAGHVDPDQVVISGGSAGGYTTLCALTFHDDFAAGASYYGVGDLAALAEHTHKFESRYLDGLVGPYPESEDTYRLRSPLFHTDELSRPVILLQGLDDKVVPPEQAGRLAEALEAKGIAHRHLAFPGEGHGFRKAETIAEALTAELAFYGQVLGFEPAS